MKETFQRAFDTGIGTCNGSCACGREFYDSEGPLDEGERERLQTSGATNVGQGFGYVEFEGVTYIDVCECWHSRAEQIMRFIDGHALQIAKYLTLERERKTREADHAPIVG